MPESLITSFPNGSRQMQRYDEHRTLLVDAIMVKFTPVEYQLLVPLLDGRTVADEELIRIGLGCQACQREYERLSKYIYKMHGKLRPVGLGICRVPGGGYMLVEAIG